MEVKALKTALNTITYGQYVTSGNCNNMVSEIHWATVEVLCQLGYLELAGYHRWKITKLGRLCLEMGHEYAQAYNHPPLPSDSDWNALESNVEFSTPNLAYTSSGYGYIGIWDDDLYDWSILVMDGNPDYTAPEPVECPRCHGTDTKDYNAGRAYILDLPGYMGQCNTCGYAWSSPYQMWNK